MNRKTAVRCCALLTIAVLLTAVSFSALAEEDDEEVECTTWRVSLNEGVRLDVDTILVQQVLGAIEEAGMENAFGSLVSDPESYSVIMVAEFVQADAGEPPVLRLFIPGVYDEELFALAGIVSDGNVTWETLEITAVDEDIVTVRLTAEQADDLRNHPAVLAILSR